MSLVSRISAPVVLVVIAIVSVTLASTTALASIVPNASSTAAKPNLVKNGSFESPVVANPCPNGGSTNPTPGICTYFGGSTGVSHWVVGGNSIDLTASSVWMAAKGHQSIDLSGDAPGSVTQKIATVKGRSYVLRWALAGNWDCGQPVKTMAIYWDGALKEKLKFNTTGHSTSHMGWVFKQITAKATSAASSIEFADATPDHSLCGATLDAVSLRQT